MTKETLKNHLKDILEDDKNSILPLDIRLDAYTQSLLQALKS